jgi:hypothetical protein
MPKPKGLGLPVSSTCANQFDWTYRVSTGVLRLGIACRDDLFKQAQSFTIDVAGGIQIAVVMDATGTYPVTIRQSQSSVRAYGSRPNSRRIAGRPQTD